MGDLAMALFGRLGAGGTVLDARAPGEHRTLEIADPAADGPVVADNGRSWPTLGEALGELAAEGWRIVGATRQAGRERYLLRRPQP